MARIEIGTSSFNPMLNISSQIWYLRLVIEIENTNFDILINV